LLPSQKDGQKYFGLTPARNHFLQQQRPDGNSFVPQTKLDCALQLARTMAHDYLNNALTGFGHTSLLLTRRRPDIVARFADSVERRRPRRDIASDLSAFSRQEKKSRASSRGNLNSCAAERGNLQIRIWKKSSDVQSGRIICRRI